jgi:hypothetical protein
MFLHAMPNRCDNPCLEAVGIWRRLPVRSRACPVWIQPDPDRPSRLGRRAKSHNVRLSRRHGPLCIAELLLILPLQAGQMSPIRSLMYNLGRLAPADGKGAQSGSASEAAVLGQGHRQSVPEGSGMWRGS